MSASAGGPPTQAAVATLRITSWRRSQAFYVDGLGLRVDWEYRGAPHAPALLQLSRGALRLHVSEREADGRPGGVLRLYVDDVDDWYEALCLRELRPDAPPADQPWGDREFRVRDPDGNQVCFATRRSG
jgi:catechol 2,3-dioxygenase-like lactoylglutathione lyase family enzyme